MRDNYIGSSNISNSIDVNHVAQDVEINGMAIESGDYSVLNNRISGIRNLTGYALNGIRFLFGTTSGNSMDCRHNHISDLQAPSGTDIDLVGISVVATTASAQATVAIEQDTIRNLSIGAAVSGTADVYGIGFGSIVSANTYFCSGSVKNNTIDNLENQVPGASTRCAGIAHFMGYKTGFNVEGNNISNLRGTSNGMWGILFSPETAAMITGSAQGLTLTGNNIFNLVNEHSGEVYVIGIAFSGRAPVVANNRISDLQAANTIATESLVAGIFAFDFLPAQTYKIQNNMVALDHSTHGSAQAAGIYSALNETSSVFQTNAAFNSVYIGGQSDFPSAAFVREGSGKVSLVNNIFYNDCTGSGTTHTAIANIAAMPTQNWLQNASDHNYLVSRDPEALNLWGADPQSLAAWQTVSNGDFNSPTRVAGTQTNANLLFVETATADLDLQLDQVDEVLVLQNAGIAVVGVTADFFGNLRDPNTPDLGAREFATIFVNVGETGIPRIDIRVSPNPATDFIEVSATADTPTDYWLQLTDIHGKTLLRMEIADAAGFQRQISLQQLPAGRLLPDGGQCKRNGYHAGSKAVELRLRHSLGLFDLKRVSLIRHQPHQPSLCQSLIHSTCTIFCFSTLKRRLR